MKRIYNIYKKFVLVVVALSAITMTSCTDFLTIIPPEKTVHENFWQTKDDVNGILATSYLKLLSTDAVKRAIVWGELRADNLMYMTGTSNEHEIRYIIESNILPDNSYAKWNVYYEAIANANLVIEYADLVCERDPDFTEGDLQVVLGEMYAMRALCHFYLVRTFRDIPMAMTVAANDADLPEYRQVHPLEALRLIMEDLNRAEKMVMPSGNFPNRVNNYGRITKNAVLAMKADVSLWQAAFAKYYEGESTLVASGDVDKYYDVCISSCEAVLENMEKIYLDEKKEDKLSSNNPYALEVNMGKSSDLINGLNGQKQWESTAYDKIFGTRSSFETIFEHHIDGELIESSVYGKGIYELYGTKGQPVSGQLCVPTNFANIYATDDVRKYSYTDYTNAPKSEDEKKTFLTVAKYTASKSVAEEYRSENSRDANWIVYRKADVMLMLAEALVSRSGAVRDDFKTALKLIKGVNYRSRIDGADDEKRNNVTRQLKSPYFGQNAQLVSTYNNSTDSETFLELIQQERLRELSFEGKRWYDLVRKALREKTTANILFVADKLGADANIVKSKMTSIDGLFFPIHEDEIRFNKLLKQNPAYATNGSSSEMVK